MDANLPDSPPSPAPARPAAGWYPDPAGSGRLRWWDGAMWGRIANPNPGPAYADYRPPLPRWHPTVGRVTQGLLAIAAVLLVANAANLLQLLALLDDAAAGRQVSMDRANAIDNRTVVFALSYLACFLVTTTAFLTWLRTAYGSDRVDARDLRHSNGWAVGAWFVPFLNLVRGPQIVRDLWAGALRRKTGAATPAIGWLGAWWATYLLGGVLSGVSERMTPGDDVEGVPWLDAARSSSQVELVSDAVLVLSAALLIVLIAKIGRALRPAPAESVPPTGEQDSRTKAEHHEPAESADPLQPPR